MSGRPNFGSRQVNRVKTQLAAQYEEARAQYEEEAKQRNALVTQFRNLQQENDGLHGALKESEEQKAYMQVKTFAVCVCVCVCVCVFMHVCV